MKTIGIIPARMGSTRFPGKPMAKLANIPMIGHCYFRSMLCKTVDEVYVATCDQVIYDYIISVGGKALMTSDKHERASERCAEALGYIEAEGMEIDVVALIQGDEPIVMPEMVDELVAKLKEDSSINITNLMNPLTPENQPKTNFVKVVVDRDFNAMYFSREPIPSLWKEDYSITRYRQNGLIAFRRDTLVQYVQWEPSQYEIIESVDMNRVLEYGHDIRMIVTHIDSDSVDTPEDLVRVSQKMESDTLLDLYKDLA